MSRAMSSMAYRRNQVLKKKKEICEKYPNKYKEWMCLAKKKHPEKHKIKRCQRPCVTGSTRCKFHGGMSPGAPKKSGGRYSIKSKGRFIEVYEKFLNDPNAINLSDELALLRSFVVELMEAKEDIGEGIGPAQRIEIIEKLQSILDSIGSMAERLRKIHMSYFSMEALALVIQQLITIIENSVTVCPHCNKDIRPVRDMLCKEILGLNVPGLQTTEDTEYEKVEK
jgi:hypothetical protein